MKARKWTLGIVALVALVGLAFVTGCDPEKTGGGGLMQSYDAGTGQYK